MEIVLLDGSFTKEEQDRPVRHVTSKVPIGLIEKLFLEVHGDSVTVSCELRNVRELRKMGGCCIGCPEDWNAAKLAELRDTLPNIID